MSKPFTFPFTENEVIEIKSKLYQILKDKSFKLAPPDQPFILTSGLTSPYYMDGKQTTSDAEGLYCLAAYILHQMQSLNVDAVGGPVIGADPIVGAISALSHLAGKPVPLFLVRKEAKSHGTHNLIDGTPVEGRNVLVVEDVITTGGSVIKAVKALQDAGAIVKQTICIVDREQGGRKAFTELGIDYVPIFSINEFLPDELKVK